MQMITVNELFSGIGAFRKALERLGIEHEIVGISEIDKYAIQSYEAIYGKTRNYGDISKVEALDYADLWTYGFPCQDLSQAGHQKGIIKGVTRSGLLYEVQRLLATAIERGEAPKYLIMENVKPLVGNIFKAEFDGWLSWLYDNGYMTYWQILNAKDYGIPQNRERVFAISMRFDVDFDFLFPAPIPFRINLYDITREKTKRKYIKQKTINNWYLRSTTYKEKGFGFHFRPVDVTKKQNNQTIGTITASGNNISQPIFVETINGHKQYWRPTSKERWLLMGFDETDYQKAKEGQSETNLNHQAGNSIVVDVLEAILKELLIPDESRERQLRLTDL